MAADFSQKVAVFLFAICLATVLLIISDDEMPEVELAADTEVLAWKPFKPEDNVFASPSVWPVKGPAWKGIKWKAEDNAWASPPPEIKTPKFSKAKEEHNALRDADAFPTPAKGPAWHKYKIDENAWSEIPKPAKGPAFHKYKAPNNAWAEPVKEAKFPPWKPYKKDYVNSWAEFPKYEKGKGYPPHKKDRNVWSDEPFPQEVKTPKFHKHVKEDNFMDKVFADHEKAGWKDPIPTPKFKSSSSPAK